MIKGAIVKTIINILSIVFMIVFGGACSKTSSTFQSNTSILGSSSASPASSTITLAWQAPQIIDWNTPAGTVFDMNIPLAGGSYKFPMQVFNTGVGQFFVGFNSATAAGPTSVNMLVTQPTVFSSDSWATGLNAFTQIDSGASINSQNAMSIVDNYGNATMVFFAKATGSHYRPLATRMTAGTQTWSLPYDLSSTAVTVTAATDSLVNTAGLAIDPTSNDVLTVWCQGTTAYYNENIFMSGWIFNTSSGLDSTWSDASACSSNSRGMDVAIGPDGTGWAAFATTTNTIFLRKWSAGAWSATEATLANASVDAFPKIFIDSAGNTDVFFLRNLSIGAGAPSTADLFHAQGTTAATTFSVPVSLATGITVSYSTEVDVTYNSHIFKPLLRHSGNSAAVYGYVKNDGSTDRLYVSQYSGNSNWTTASAIDAGSSAHSGISWADLSVNAAGQIAAVYSAVGSTDALEHVYGNVYTGGSWTGETQLDVSNALAPVAGPGKYRPSVSIDSTGQAVATFSMPDTGGIRRAVEATFR